MKAFNIYQFETLGGHFEAIKDGWSWPGFFFGWIWCFVKGLPTLGVVLLIASIAASVLNRMNTTLSLVVGMAALGVAVWLGSQGNQLRERKLLDEGYAKVGSIEASSPEQAVADYEANMQSSVQVTI